LCDLWDRGRYWAVCGTSELVPFQGCVFCAGFVGWGMEGVAPGLNRLRKNSVFCVNCTRGVPQGLKPTSFFGLFRPG
jgi:hypothetical protein